MQKKIIALAIASALTAPAVAMADSVGNVSIYGQIRAAVQHSDDGAATNPATTNGLADNKSRLGVKGSEDLGGGLSAVFQAEGETNFNTTTTFGFNRNTYIGLASADMGTVLVGRHDTPYKIATRSLDFFAYTAADTTVSGHNLRLNDVLAYISPSMSGLTVAGAYVFSNDDSNVTNKSSAYSLSGMYTQGGIYATLAIQNYKGGDNGAIGGVAGLAVGTEASAYKLAGGYTMDAYSVNATVEKTTSKTTAAPADSKATNLNLQGKFNLSETDAVKLGYAKFGDTTNNTDGSKRVSLAYDHNLSKRTTVYALYTKSTANASAGADPSVFGLGLNHAF